MSNKKLLGVLVDVENKKVEAIEIADDLEKYYEVLNCTCIDIVQRRIGRKNFTIICDDEGLFNAAPKISAINNLGQAQLVGNLFIVAAGSDEDGNLIGLSKSEADYILKRCVKLATRNYPDPYPMLTQCEY